MMMFGMFPSLAMTFRRSTMSSFPTMSSSCGQCKGMRRREHTRRAAQHHASQPVSQSFAYQGWAVLFNPWSLQPARLLLFSYRSSSSTSTSTCARHCTRWSV